MASYEIQTMRGGRWVNTSVLKKEDEALAAAEKLFQDRKCEGIKVVSTIELPNGTMSEKEIFIRTRSVQEEDSDGITKIDKPPPICTTLEDYYDYPSRAAFNRIFRSYCDKAVLTPTELLYDAKEFKRLQEKASMISTAVDRVSSLQAALGGGDAKRRREEIFRASETITMRALSSEKITIPPVESQLSALFAKLPPSDEKPDFLVLRALTKDLLSNRHWSLKLERLCKLALNETDPHALSLLDGVIADVMGSNIIQDILGWQPNLGQAICRLIDLAEGKLPEVPNDAGESSVLLNSLFAKGSLPISKKSLVDRTHRQLRSSIPLSKSAPEKEQEVFKQVVERLLLPSGLYDGAETADALTKRYSRSLDIGGKEGERKALSATCRMMPDKVASIIYLSEIIKLESSQEYMDVILERFEDILFVRHISDLCIKGLSGRDRLIRATGAYTAILSAQIPETLKKKITERIDAIIDRFLVDEQIIEKMNDPNVHLRDRTSRLIQFCAAGVLPPEGKAITRAKERVVELLRQPHFEESFVEGITDPAMIQQTLRLLHSLMIKAGIKA